MSTAQWATYIGAAAATLAVLGMVYRQVVRPLARGIQRFLDLLERLQEVLTTWPALQTNVLTSGQQLTELSLTVGQLDARVAALEHPAGVRRPPRKATTS